METWKDIKGWEGKYQVSNLGRVKSLNYCNTGNPSILKTGTDCNGYLKVTLYRNNKGKTYNVHRLVAEAFIPNPQCFPEVNHKDETRTNNNVENLEWCTRQYNLNYGTRTQKQSKLVMCVETGEVFNSVSEVQRMLGFPSGDISKCCNGKRNTCHNFHWQYIEKAGQ